VDEQITIDDLNQIIGSLYTKLYISSRIVDGLKNQLRIKDQSIMELTLKYNLQTQRLENVMTQAGYTLPLDNPTNEAVTEIQPSSTTT